MNGLLSLQEIFIKKIFRIPDYQRGYSWGDKQLIEFWDDIINLPTNKEHYTGMISLKRLNEEYINNWNDEKWLIKNKGYNVYHVVDGQQRLTTCVILINEIIKFVKEMPINQGKDLRDIFLNSTRLSEIIEEYLVIVKPDSEEQLKTYKFGYEKDDPSYEFFKYKILEDNNNRKLQETFYTLNLENAKMFFRQALKNLYKSEQYDYIEELFLKLTQKLKFNIYNIDDDFNTFMAFETMNNRGKKLSNLELLKNRLIYLTTLFNKPEDEENKMRQRINEAWRIVYEYLGKNKEKSLDDDEFLQAHWIIYFGYSRTKGRNYEDDLLNTIFTQKNIVNPTEAKIKLTMKDIGSYIDSLRELIPYWYDLNFPILSNQEHDLKEWLMKLDRLGWGNFKPLTTVILSKMDISKEDKIKYLKLVERYIFMHYRFSLYQGTFGNSHHYKLSYYLYYNNIKIQDVLEDLNKIDYLKKDNIVPINSVINKFDRYFKKDEGYYSWPTLKYVLYEYELYLMNDQANQKIYPENLFKKDEKDKVSIEHIYPKADDKEYWQERFREYNKEEKRYLTGTLGNLLPLSQSINSALQNDSFDEKKNREPRGYCNGSHSEMEVAKNDEWTANEILSRGLKILSFMEERWDFKFRNEYDKYKILFLDFLYEDEIEEYDEDIEEITEKKLKKKITKEMVEYLYEKFKEVLKESITIEEAAENVSKEKEMNKSSAYMYLAALQSMYKGIGYRRRVADNDLIYFLDKFKEDFDIDIYKNAIRSVKQWSDYAKAHNMNPKRIDEIIELNKFEV